MLQAVRGKANQGQSCTTISTIMQLIEFRGFEFVQICLTIGGWKEGQDC